jgi:hypothetical protein
MEGVMGRRHEPRNGFTFFLFVILSLVLVYTSVGCELTEEEKAVLDDSFDPSNPPGDVPPPPVQPACFNERFVQPEAEITKKIDILFVTDTSGSLNDERPAIAQGIDAFVGALPMDVDYRVAVMLAHGSTSNYSGVLYQKDSEPFVLDSQQMSLEDIRYYLERKLRYVRGDGDSDGGEEGLFSLYTGLMGNNLEQSRTQGFFREDAALAVVFIADENDICARYPDGVTPVYDPNHKEGPAFDRDCADVFPESVLAKLRTVQAGNPLLVSGIVYNREDTVPAGGENEVGYGYLELIDLANGMSIDLADGHFQDGLEQIGTLATVKLHLITEFTLARTEINLDTINVQVDGLDSPFTYVLETNDVQLHEPGGALSVVDINYCLIIDGPIDEDGDGLDDITGEPLY